MRLMDAVLKLFQEHQAILLVFTRLSITLALSVKELILVVIGQQL
jgi:hypothetical protein